MKIYIDIDNTITFTKNTDYSQAIPNYINIQKVNCLYDLGHEITMWTARGTETKIDHTKLTKNQLASWGVKYHKLLFGKPAFDLFIDDKAINVLDWDKYFLKNDKTFVDHHIKNGH
jgi:hypothetical protein